MVSKASLSMASVQQSMEEIIMSFAKINESMKRILENFKILHQHIIDGRKDCEEKFNHLKHLFRELQEEEECDKCSSKSSFEISYLPYDEDGLSQIQKIKFSDGKAVKKDGNTSGPHFEHEGQERKQICAILGISQEDSPIWAFDPGGSHAVPSRSISSFLRYLSISLISINCRRSLQTKIELDTSSKRRFSSYLQTKSSVKTSKTQTTFTPSYRPLLFPFLSTMKMGLTSDSAVVEAFCSTEETPKERPRLIWHPPWPKCITPPLFVCTCEEDCVCLALEETRGTWNRKLVKSNADDADLRRACKVEIEGTKQKIVIWSITGDLLRPLSLMSMKL